MEEKLIKSITNVVSEIDTPLFWELIPGKGGSINVKIKSSLLIEFLKSRGFKRVNKHTLHVNNNIIHRVDNEYIYQYCLKCIRNCNDYNSILDEFTIQGERLLFKNKGFLIGLDCDDDLKIIKDTKDTSYHCFKNVVVKVENGEPFKIIKYDELDFCVWSEKIIDFELNLLDDDNDKSMFSKFLENVTESEEHYNSLCSAIGYMLHRYKPKNSKALIFNDCLLYTSPSPRDA